MDMHLDAVARDLLAPAVEALLELRARERLSGPVEERLQERELAPRHADLAPEVAHLVRRRIDAETAELDHGLRAARVAPHERTDARGELVELEGLHQIIVGA